MNKPGLDQLRIERRPEPTGASPLRWGLAAMLLLAVGAAAAYWWLRAEPAVAVETVTVRERAGGPAIASTVLNASGYVTARRQATVSSKFTGKVTEVLIEEGMTVEEGQVLARLDDANVRASFDLAEAQRVSTERSLKETEALLREARLNYDRTNRLVERELASESELDRSRALTGSLAAQLDKKKADVVVAERQVDIYRQQLEDTVIRAPFAGVVVAKNAQPGEMISPVSAGGGFTRTGIGTIVDMASLEIEIDVNEAYINRISPGQEAIATLDAWPDWKIPSHVIAIIPTADRQRATVEVRVGFDELDTRILPDMGVKVAFQEAAKEPVAERPSGLMVPAGAVRSVDGRDFVFVVSDGHAERRAIAIGGQNGDSLLIQSGLTAGESVVVNAPPELADGAAVREKSDD
ncbi:MAG: efflux RND transporter periplasmic adaptor subunit [Xanthomonadales bacterium]|nr:efflux RND transporter periplasmic adaptor subunit [Xanthomonadales bacterium]